MDIHGHLARGLFVPFFEKRWGMAAPQLRRELERGQWLDPEQIRAQQLERLRALLDFAATSNPFYRERLRAVGFAPGDLRSLDDLAGIPLLTKDDVRGNADALISEGFSKDTMTHQRTGGSTGVPLHLYWDDDANRLKFNVTKRHDAWAHHVPGARRAALWGDTNKSYPFKVRLYKTLCERTVFLDTLEMDEAHLDVFVGELRRFRPTALLGHAHSIFFFADHLRRKGIDDVRFDGIISTAETLTDEERKVIEAVFGNVVFDRYGCEELSIIASECEQHDGLHVAAENVHVEVLDGDGNTPGRIVVTDLNNRGMPFVRYEVGDLATVATGTCACGRGLPRLQRVFGRTSDILYAPDGRRISGISILDTFVIHVPGVKQAQIVQDALDHVLLRVVPALDDREAIATGVRNAALDVFGAAMRCDVEFVERIEPTPRGKYQFSICEIDDPRTETAR